MLFMCVLQQHVDVVAKRKEKKEFLMLIFLPPLKMLLIHPLLAILFICHKLYKRIKLYDDIHEDEFRILFSSSFSISLLKLLSSREMSMNRDLKDVVNGEWHKDECSKRRAKAIKEKKKEEDFFSIFQESDMRVGYCLIG